MSKVGNLSLLFTTILAKGFCQLTNINFLIMKTRKQNVQNIRKLQLKQISCKMEVSFNKFHED